MTTLRFEAPLNWPDWIAVTPRASQRNDHGFPDQLNLNECLNFLDQELQELHCTGTLYLDIEQPLMDRSRKKVGSRTGVALHIKYHGRNYVLACDRWLTIEANIYAMHLALRQWRSMERWGMGNIPRLLKGFEPGSVQANDVEEDDVKISWMRSLGLGPTATLEDATAVYHRRAKHLAHDEDALTQLNMIMDQARDYFNKRGD